MKPVLESIVVVFDRVQGPHDRVDEDILALKRRLEIARDHHVALKVTDARWEIVWLWPEIDDRQVKGLAHERDQHPPHQAQAPEDDGLFARDRRGDVSRRP